MICLQTTKNSDPRLRELMTRHYSLPRGFVGRNICYAVLWDNAYYGHIVAGSATKNLPGRNAYLGNILNRIINNTFFHVEKIEGRYPCRNFTTMIVEEFERQATLDWYEKYKDEVVGFETLVELPRTGEVYLKAGWVIVGQTKGFTCKRVSGPSSDGWTGRRIWNTTDLRPKLVLCKRSI
jgi:hypothetical protein